MSIVSFGRVLSNHHHLLLLALVVPTVRVFLVTIIMAHNKKKAQRVSSKKKDGKTKSSSSSRQNKNKKCPKAAAFDATKAALAAVAKGVLHPDDPVIDFCQYLATGKRVDSKTLVKKLPQTTQLMMMVVVL